MSTTFSNNFIFYALGELKIIRNLQYKDTLIYYLNSPKCRQTNLHLEASVIFSSLANLSLYCGLIHSTELKKKSIGPLLIPTLYLLRGRTVSIYLWA